MNKNVKETNSNNKKVKVKFPEVQSEGLLQIKEKQEVNKTEKKPRGFYSKKTDEELVEYTQNFCKKNNVTKRSELETKNSGLYEKLRRCNLLDSVFGPTESKPCGFYSNMSDEELIAESRKYCEENINTKRNELQRKNNGLYNQLRKRNLLDSVFGPTESKPYGFYSDKTDNELLEYCKAYCKENNITKRNELQTKNQSLYEKLRRRDLLDSVFLEQSHLKDLVDAIRNFGDGENE